MIFGPPFFPYLIIVLYSHIFVAAKKRLEFRPGTTTAVTIYQISGWHVVPKKKQTKFAQFLTPMRQHDAAYLTLEANNAFVT